MKAVLVRVTDESYDWLSEQMKEERRSRAFLVRELIEKATCQTKCPTHPPELPKAKQT